MIEEPERRIIVKTRWPCPHGQWFSHYVRRGPGVYEKCEAALIVHLARPEGWIEGQTSIPLDGGGALEVLDLWEVVEMTEAGPLPKGRAS